MTKKTIKKTHKKSIKNPIVAVLWQDALFSLEDNLRYFSALPHLITGVVIETNDRFLNLATSVIYDKKKKRMVPIDGFLIPQGVIIDIKEIGYYEKQKITIQKLPDASMKTLYFRL